MKSKPLASLFHSDLDILECYAGLVHFATRPGQLQRFEEVAKREHVRLAESANYWIRQGWGREALGELGEHLEFESRRAFDRMAVAVAGAVIALDKELSRRSLEAHGSCVQLPWAPPFESGRYRLLRPPERPIEAWIEEGPLPQIPRKSGDMEIDLPAAWNLEWRLFPLAPSPFAVEVLFENLPQHVAVPLREGIEARRLTVGAASPSAGLEYDFQSYPDEHHPEDGTPYRFVRRKGKPGVAEQEIRRTLERCREAKIDVLIYPELTLDPDLLGHLRNGLRWSDEDRFPCLVIAGSFHEAADEAGRWVNRARVFDQDGEEILRHDKLKRFRLTPHDIAAIRREAKRDGLCGALGIDAETGGHERIEQGRELRIVDGPLGRMITSICLDYCGDSILGIAKHSLANLFWVPAMTPAMEAFEKRARDLGTFSRATTVVVNSEWLLDAAGVPAEARDALRTLCYVPCREREAVPGEVDESLPSLYVFRIGEILKTRAEPAC